MTDTNEKIRALFLTALMVGSVFAMTIAFSGSAAAATYNRGTSANLWDTATGSVSSQSGAVGSGATVYQGERIDNLDGSLDSTNSAPSSLTDLERTGGDDAGLALQNPIPEDATRGTYSADGTNTGSFNVSVATPRILDFEVRNSDGSDVSGGTLTTGSGGSVYVEYNYYRAEDMSLTVEDSGGTDVTSEIVNGASSLNPRDQSNTNSVSFSITPGDVNNGDYTFTVEGVESLSFGEATESTTVTITDDQEANVDLASGSATQGERVDFTVSGTPEGSLHVVTIESSEFRDNTNVVEASQLFRSVGDTVDTGVINAGAGNDRRATASDQAVANVNPGVSYGGAGGTSTVGPSSVVNASDNGTPVNFAYAVVEIDGGDATGRIDTQFLDDTTVDVEVHSKAATEAHANSTIGLNNLTAVNNPDLTDAVDDDDIDIEEGEITIDSPTSPYIVGDEVDVNGTTGPGTDYVAVYARDNAQWEPVELDANSGTNTIQVDGDNTYEDEDIRLSNGTFNGNNILTLEGTYRFGLIDTDDVTVTSTTAQGNPQTTAGGVSTSNFNSGISESISLRVVSTELTGNFSFINGQIADQDRLVDVNGTAPGQQDIWAVFIGERGNTYSTQVSVGDGTFDEDEIDVNNLQQGAATAHFLSVGRDGNWGDNTGTDSDDDPLQAPVTTNLGGSGEQVRERVLDNTVEASGSDDLIVTQRFRLTEALTSIEDTYPEGTQDASTIESGETLVVDGLTNRYPADNSITVELLNQDEESLALTSADTWDESGQWSVNIDTSDIDPGNYTAEADDGISTDRVSVSIVAERMTPTATPTPEPETETPEPETDTPTEGGDGPGFGVVVAVIAMLAAALLAARRNT